MNKMKKTAVSAAIAMTIGGAAAIPQTAAADILEFNWNGLFTMLDPAGNPLNNSSNPNGAKGNNFQTGVTGTMSFDTVTGAGTATLVPFDFFNGSLPAEAVGIEMQSFGDADTGDGDFQDGSLIIGNMIFNWDGNNGIPVSLVMDAAGMFGAMQMGALSGGPGAIIDQSTVAGFGAIPASDGTYTNATFGYLAVGAVPIATTLFNTSSGPGCAPGSCLGVNPSGVLPVVVDTSENANIGYYTPGNTLGIGGNPMQDGPFFNFNANFDITSLEFTGVSSGTIGPFNVFPTQVPVPAAVWLFGSGLVGLVGVARRKKAKV